MFLIKSLGIRIYRGKRFKSPFKRDIKPCDDLMKAPSEELSSIYDVGKTMANSNLEFFQKKENALLIEKLKQANVNTQAF
jgi:NAD-dependent DNA ligase